MRIATYNVERFNALLNDDAEPLGDGRWSRRHDVTRADQLAASDHYPVTIDPAT